MTKDEKIECLENTLRQAIRNLELALYFMTQNTGEAAIIRAITAAKEGLNYTPNNQCLLFEEKSNGPDKEAEDEGTTSPVKSLCEKAGKAFVLD